MKTKIPLLLCLALAAASASAGTMLSVGASGEAMGGCVVIYAGQGYRVGWSQADTYDGVSVSATLSSGVANQTGRAYLTTQIGPGTTTANEIASTNFTFPLSPSSVVLFQSLHLAAGTYYLSVIGDSTSSGSCWNSFMTTNATAAPDVTSLGCFGVAGGIVSPYFPSSPVYTDSPTPPGIDVEGTDLNHPTLNIAQTGGVLLIYWTTNSAGFSLQSATTLSPTNWSDVTQRPAIISDSFVFGTTADTNTLFRLMKIAP